MPEVEETNQPKKKRARKQHIVAHQEEEKVEVREDLVMDQATLEKLQVEQENRVKAEQKRIEQEEKDAALALALQNSSSSDSSDSSVDEEILAAIAKANINKQSVDVEAEEGDDEEL